MKLKKVIALTLILCLMLSIVAADTIENHIRQENAVLNFGGSLWHDNYSKGMAVFPLAEAWTSKIGRTAAQPIIIDDYVITLAENKLSIFPLYSENEKNKSLKEYNIITKYPISESANIFAIRNNLDDYSLIIPFSNGEVQRLDVRIAKGQSGSKINITEIWRYILSDNSSSKKHSKLLTKDITMLGDSNPSLSNKLYVGFGTYSGQLVVLDYATGKPLSNGILDYRGSMGSGSGVTYRDFASIVVPVNSDVGSLLGGTVINGMLMNDHLTENLHQEGLVAPTAYTVIDNPVYGEKTGILLMQDKTGTIIGYDTKNRETAFKIDKYRGTHTANSFSINGKHVLITLAENKNINRGKGKVICLDILEAVETASLKADKTANDTILFEENTVGETFTGALALSAAEPKDETHEIVYKEVFLIADRGEKDNIRMYYMDQYYKTSRKPIPVPYAFSEKISEGVYTTKEKYTIPGGVVSPMSYASGYLIAADGEGNLHAFTAKKENNLAIMNFRNTEEKLSRGKTYIAQADVVNYTGEDKQQIPLEFYINGALVNNTTIDIPVDGLTVNFQYTVPKDYAGEQVLIEGKLNMIKPRQFEETVKNPYADNVTPKDFKIVDEIDLEARNLLSSSPALADSWHNATVEIVNNSDLEHKNVLVHFKVNGRTIKQERVNLAPRAVLNKGYNFQTPKYNTKVLLSVVVDPNREVNDINRANNTARKDVNVAAATSSDTGT